MLARMSKVLGPFAYHSDALGGTCLWCEVEVILDFGCLLGSEKRQPQLVPFPLSLARHSICLRGYDLLRLIKGGVAVMS